MTFPNKVDVLAAAAAPATSQVVSPKGPGQFLSVLEVTQLDATGGVTVEDSADGVSYADVVPIGATAVQVTAVGRYVYGFLRPFVRVKSDGVASTTATARLFLNGQGKIPAGQAISPAAVGPAVEEYLRASL